MKSWNRLYDRDSNGGIKVWAIAVEGDTIITTHGKLGMKQIVTEKQIKVGKNIGRSNETTPAEQALSEAQSTYNKKKDKGYVEELGDAESKDKEILPMLAHKFSERSHDIITPCFVQPKLNGVRVLARKKKSGMEYISRGGKFYTTIGHLDTLLSCRMGVGDIFDGECYVHGWSLQRIVSAVKKRNADTLGLEYWIYDAVDEDASFEDRIRELQSLFVEPVFTLGGKAVRLVETLETNKSGIKPAHDAYVADGYEGLMIRNKAGGYDLKNRSKNLQKMKEFDDTEFPIIGGKEGTGSDEGCVIFSCITKGGEIFSVRPRGTVEYRKELLRRLPALVGKDLTVRHQGYTDGGTPVFPVGLVIRDYE